MCCIRFGFTGNRRELGLAKLRAELAWILLIGAGAGAFRGRSYKLAEPGGACKEDIEGASG